MKESHQRILVKTEKIVREERRITAEVLECLHEIESKMIYAELAYSSLYEFCVKHLKYSEGSAHRRISAMRLWKGLPHQVQHETKLKIESGALTVSNMCVVHGFLKVEKMVVGKIYSSEEKASLLHSIENQSKLVVEKQLAMIQPKIIPQESKRVLTQELTEIKFVANELLIQKLERIKQITSNAIPNAGIAEMIGRIADDYLKRHDPVLIVERNMKKVSNTELRR